ncbi:MAG: prolyl oligopeptidase family serine peptidase [Bacillus sp. (in: firmicutes)]
MVIHGSKDPRVPIQEPEQMVNKLKKRNHPVTFIRIEDEEHTLEKEKISYLSIPLQLISLTNI